MPQTQPVSPSVRVSPAPHVHQFGAPPHKESSGRINLLGGLRTVAVCTLLSRFLGLFRDMATAAAFGLGAGGLMDAFALAFRIPNLFRRIFGEGALNAAD